MTCFIRVNILHFYLPDMPKFAKLAIFGMDWFIDGSMIVMITKNSTRSECESQLDNKLEARDLRETYIFIL